MPRDWFEEISLSKQTVAELKRRGLYDPMDLICVRPRELYVAGMSGVDLRLMRAYVMTHCARELADHERNTSRDRADVFLDRMGWSMRMIHDACKDDDEHVVHERASNVSSTHEAALRRMVERASKRRHHHGESRKNFINR